MTNQRRVERQICNLKARIFTPQKTDPLSCVISNISTLGAFINLNAPINMPTNFDLVIGDSLIPRVCRVARYESVGVGVEFLEPVRHEVEELLTEHAFKYELLFEAMSPSLHNEITITQVRLRRTIYAMMSLIERRNIAQKYHNFLA